MGRTQNAVRNLGWGIVQKFVMLFLPFITRTVLLKCLGADYLGLSGLFASVLTLLCLTELGVSNAIISTMYKPIAENDTETVCALMSLYRKTYHIIGVIILGLGIAIMPFLDKLINGDVPIDINLYSLYLIYLFNTSVSYFLFAYKNCLFIAHQRNDVNSKIQTILQLVQSIVQIVLVLTFKNYYCYAIVIPIISILTNTITAYFAKKIYPQYVCRGSLTKEFSDDVKKRVLGLMLGRISGTIRSSVDSIFISMFLGLKTVAMYSNYFYIVTAVAGIIQLVDSAMIAGVGNSIVTESLRKNYRDFKKFTFLLQWIVGWCAICILCLEQPFMSIWVGTELMFKDTMVFLCALYLFVSCIGLTRGIYTQALGMWWTLRYLSIIDIFINTILNYFFGKYFGAYGILAATIIDIAFVGIPWTTYFLFRDYFGRHLYKQCMFQYIKYFLITSFVGGLTYLICYFVSFDGKMVGFIVKATICLIVPNVCYLIIYFKNELFKESVSFFKNKLLTRG